MLRALVSFAFLLIVIAVPRTGLRADEPKKVDEPKKADGPWKGDPGVVNLSGGTLVLTGTNNYSGSTKLGSGTLQLVSPNNMIFGGGNQVFNGVISGSGTVDLGYGNGTPLNNLTQPPNAGMSIFNYTSPNAGGSGGYFSGTINGGAAQAQSGTLMISGFGVAPSVTENWASTTLTGSGTFGWDSNFPASSYATYVLSGNAASNPTTPIPAGPVFYIITEGAGIGDNVRSVPCTGKETVLDAIGHVNGISQVSGTKIWIARPSPASRDKSTILNVDWEAISRRGVNATNYTLMPGDRLVFGQDPLITQSNRISKKTAIVERLDGVVGLTSSTLSGLNSLSAADRAVIKDLVRKGVFTDDEEIKRLMLDAMLLREQGDTKTVAKAATEPKAEQTVVITATVDAKAEAGMETAAGAMAAKAEGKWNATAADGSAPHELAMRSLPAYRIEPPDVVSIEMLKLIPLPPYRAAIFDVLQIRANALPDHPIDKPYIVDADGKVDLGPPYGTVKVAGMKIDEITTTLNKFLRQWLRDPAAYVQLARVSGLQPVSGQYLVGPDGTINLRAYGRVNIAGKTLAEARNAIQNQLKQYLDSPELMVDVVAYNSKVYYIVTQGAGLGDNIRRLPSTGNETVMDAIAQVNGLSQISSQNICIVRPNAADPGKPTILHVDWDGISRRGVTATNFQIFPRDRIYIAEDPLVTRANLIGKKTAIVERLSGVVGLTTGTIRGLNSTPGADAVLKELVRKGAFTDDEAIKQILQEIIRVTELERKNTPPKGAEKGKAGR
jgi:polysaccharide biosynthesis/export protein